MRKKELIQQNNLLREEVKELNLSLERSFENFMTLSNSFDELLELYMTMKTHDETMLKILKSYSLWDPIILNIIKKGGSHYPDDEGPATIYLKEVGQYPKDYGH